jgi:CDP-glucose 4,6-dehydratase
VTAAFRASFGSPAGLHLASARAGNVIAGGDWTRDGLIADLVRALAADEALAVRYPEAVRPWQHVLEPLSGYLLLGARLLAGDAGAADAWNFGPDARDDATVGAIVERFLAGWGSGTWRDASDPANPHEAAVLRLSAQRAMDDLGWRPRWRLDEALERTVDWYRTVLADPRRARDACERDLAAYRSA